MGNASQADYQEMDPALLRQGYTPVFSDQEMKRGEEAWQGNK